MTTTTETPKSNGRAMGVIFLTVVLDLIGFGIVIPLMTFYAESFHATPSQVTLLMTCYSVAQFLFAPLWGQLSDRVGRRPVLLGSIFLTAVSLAGFASARALWMLFLARTLHGVFTANISTAQACMADITTKENRARGMGLIGAGFGIGFTLGPFIGGVLAKDSLTLPIWVAAGMSLLNFLLAVFILPETRRPGAVTLHRRISLTGLADALRHPAVGLAILLTFVQVFSFALMESTFTLFAEHVHALKAPDVGKLFGFVGVVGMIVQGGLIHQLVKRVGERPLVPVGLAILAVGLFLLPFAPLGWALTGTFVLLGLGQSVATPSLQSLISKAASADDQGKILGSAQSMSALARASGPYVGGLLFERVSPNMPFFTAGVLLIAATFLAVPAAARAAGADT